MSRKLMMIGCLAGMCLSAWAGSAVVDGTDFVVTAAAGESFTNSTAVGDYARLVKRGAGEARPSPWRTARRSGSGRRTRAARVTLSSRGMT